MSSDFNLNVLERWLFLFMVFLTKNRELFAPVTWPIKRDSHWQYFLGNILNDFEGPKSRLYILTT